MASFRSKSKAKGSEILENNLVKKLNLIIIAKDNFTFFNSQGYNMKRINSTLDGSTLESSMLVS